MGATGQVRERERVGGLITQKERKSDGFTEEVRKGERGS